MLGTVTASSCSTVNRPSRPSSASIISPAWTAGAAVLVDHDVREPVCDQHVPRARVKLERDLVRHRRRREEERGLLAEELRGPRLEIRDRRVLAPLLVTDFRGGDRRPHPVRRTRRGVGAQVDHRRTLADVRAAQS